jgi:hypothetical protein
MVLAVLLSHSFRAAPWHFQPSLRAVCMLDDSPHLFRIRFAGSAASFWTFARIGCSHHTVSKVSREEVLQSLLVALSSRGNGMQYLCAGVAAACAETAKKPDLPHPSFQQLPTLFSSLLASLLPVCARPCRFQRI